eukprot:760696-Hanusia_phi.AAC.1
MGHERVLLELHAEPEARQSHAGLLSFLGRDDRVSQAMADQRRRAAAGRREGEALDAKAVAEAREELREPGAKHDEAADLLLAGQRCKHSDYPSMAEADEADPLGRNSSVAPAM